MKLYDECFDGVGELLSSYTVKDITASSTRWQDVGENQMIFQNDTAFELGGGDLPAISSIALTDSADLVPCDQVLLCGNDLDKISADTPFARIALMRVNDDKMGTGEALYQAIRKIEYTRYHISPKGYMMRISAFTRREAARVSKTAVKNGISFADVGKLFVDAYHKNANVEAVKLIFITDPAFDYSKLNAIMERSENITKALDHLMKDLKMDCHSCKLQDICAEVEELCNKDFAK